MAAAAVDAKAVTAKAPNIEEYPSAPLDFAFQEIKTWEELLTHPPTGNAYSGPGQARPLLPGEAVKKKDDEKDKQKDEPYWAKKGYGYGGFSSYSTPTPAAAATPAHTGVGHSVQPITIITAQQLAAQQNSGPATVQMPVVGVLRVNNNELSAWTECLPTLTLLLWQPALNLNWIDLSHNKLTTIDPCLVGMTNLQVLYLHGNCITEFSQVPKLAALSKLTKLSLHGNELITTDADTKRKSVARLEDTPFYRSRLVHTLQGTNLKQLDFSAVTPRDRQYAAIWYQNHSKRTYPKRSQNESPTGGPAGRVVAKSPTKTALPLRSPNKSPAK